MYCIQIWVENRIKSIESESVKCDLLGSRVGRQTEATVEQLKGHREKRCVVQGRAEQCEPLLFSK